VWATTPAGKRYRGAGAASHALDQIVVAPIFSLLYAIPGLHQLEDAVYRWVAEHRGRFPGIHPRYGQPGGHCALPGRPGGHSE
jgi:predicted DCC family thiol-disulfide oxidoreductase YuxK